MANVFDCSMSTEQLTDWLLAKGLSHKDCEILKDEEFTGDSFLLLDSSTMQELEIKRGGQILLQKLLNEIQTETSASDASAHFNEVQETLPEVQAVGDKDDKKIEVVPYCTHVPEECQLSSVREECDTGCRAERIPAGAYILMDKIWADRDVVKVYFINPGLLDKWKLTTKDIMTWAAAWSQDDEVPTFDETSRMDIADVRVEFSEKSACWSHVGKCAETVKPPKPTMVLNLYKHKPEMQRSLVIHEFGHALGLEHEHQRSDFWEVMKDLIDKKKMESDIERRMSVSSRSQTKRAGYHIQYYEKKDDGDVSKSEYDPESIMHYWFDTDWLKNPNHSRPGDVAKDKSISKQAKKYLLGIHVRQKTELLAKNPSKLDFLHLKTVYTRGSQWAA